MDIVERLRYHDDERLYQEADVLMSEAANEITTLRQCVAELEKERDEALRVTFNPSVLEEMNTLTAERDALKQQRDGLVAAVKKFLDDNNPEGFGCACEPDRLCGPCSEAKRQRPLYAAIASVKEK